MLDATERKTLAWSAFLAGVLCIIPGEPPKGPRVWDFARQVLLDRVLEHRATQIAWAISAILVAHHVRKTRKEEATRAEAVRSPGVPASMGS